MSEIVEIVDFFRKQRLAAIAQDRAIAASSPPQNWS